MPHLRSYLLIALTTLCGGIFIGSQLGSFSPTTEGKTESTKAADSELIQTLRQQKVEAFYAWNGGDSDGGPLLCLVRAFDKDPNWDGGGMKLTIFNPTGQPIYQDYFESLIRLYETTALRNLASQLVFEAVYGGTGTYHLRMLDYRQGKIVKLFDGENGLFNADAEVRPQFRSDTFPAKEPFQVLLTEGVGLASSALKETRVYRYKNGTYLHVGTFPQEKLDDYLEKLLKESRRR
jgi:hypothetical protein